MKKSLFCMMAVVILLTMPIWADDYKILQLNTPHVKIGNKICKKGDVFSDREIVYWSKAGQAFKAMNVKTKKEQLFTKSEFQKKGAKTIKDFYLRTNHLSTRELVGLRDLEELLVDTFFLADTIEFNTILPTNDTHYYRIEYDVNGEKVSQRLPGSNGKLILCRALFGDPESMFETTLSVSYVNEAKSSTYHITDLMQVVLLPMLIDE